MRNLVLDFDASGTAESPKTEPAEHNANNKTFDPFEGMHTATALYSYYANQQIGGWATDAPTAQQACTTWNPSADQVCAQGALIATDDDDHPDGEGREHRRPVTPASPSDPRFRPGSANRSPLPVPPSPRATSPVVAEAAEKVRLNVEELRQASETRVFLAWA